MMPIIITRGPEKIKYWISPNCPRDEIDIKIRSRYGRKCRWKFATAEEWQALCAEMEDGVKREKTLN